MQKKSTKLYWVIILFSVFLLAGCMGYYGRLIPNPDVERFFHGKTKLPDFNYYYSGRYNLPYAVIGLKKAYKLNDRVWIKLDDHSDIYHQIENLFSTPGNNYNKIGADILDSSGNKVGIWFSYYHHTVVKVYPDKRIDVFNPYNPNRNRR
jgi:hypothetical protein